MKNDNWLLTAVLVGAAAILVIGIVVAIAEDDEPTQAQAEEDFCDNVGEYVASLGALRDVDADTPIEDFEDAREDVRITYENMINSALQLRGVELVELEEANNELRAAVDDVDDEATFQEARDSIEEEVEEVSIQLAQVMNDTVDCGSGQGQDEKSSE